MLELLLGQKSCQRKMVLLVEEEEHIFVDRHILVEVGVVEDLVVEVWLLEVGDLVVEVLLLEVGDLVVVVPWQVVVLVQVVVEVQLVVVHVLVGVL